MKEQLNSSQKEASFQPVDQNIQIIAGPGTGKTTTLVSRVVYLITECNVNPKDILVLTLTNRAIESFKNKLDEVIEEYSCNEYNPAQDEYGYEQAIDEHNDYSQFDGLSLNTFHSFCQSLLVVHGHLLRLPENWSICDTRQQVFTIERIATKSYRTVKQKSQLLNDIRLLKNSGGEANFSEETMEMYHKYQDILKSSGLLDYDDLLIRTQQLLAQFHSHETPLVKFKTILIDEFQDLTPLQWSIIMQIVNPSNRQPNLSSLTVVGDPNQTIYGFAGSDPNLFVKMRIDLHANVKTIVLSKNYRSTNEIITVTQDLINQQRRQVVPDNVANTVPKITDGSTGPLPVIVEAASNRSTIDWIIRKIKSITATGVAPNDIAILYRSGFNPSFNTLLDQLKSNGIDSVYYRGSLFEVRHVGILLTVLKVIYNKDQDLHLLYLLRYPVPILSLKDCDFAMTYATVNENISLWQAIVEHSSEWLSNTKSQAPLLDYMNILQQTSDIVFSSPRSFGAIIQGLKHYFKKTKFAYHLRRKYVHTYHFHLQEIEKFYELISSTCADYNSDSSPQPVLGYFLNNCTRHQIVPTTDQVVVSTVHAAKGLEWNTVFVVNADDETYPHKRSTDLEAIEEERRVLYVAATRAKQRLYFTYFPHYTETLDSQYISKSRFLDDKLISSLHVKTVSVTPDDQSLSKFYSQYDITKRLLDARLKYPRVYQNPVKNIISGAQLRQAKQFSTLARMIRLK